jgi:RNA polymerase sigma factor (sigma-70 family)
MMGTPVPEPEDLPPYQGMDDWELFERFRNLGDQDAFGELMKRYHEPLIRIAGKYLPRDRFVEGSDILSEVALKLQKAPFDRARGKWFSWAATIVANQAVSELRRRRRGPGFQPSIPDAIADQRSKPISPSELAELRKALADCFGRLPEPLQSMAILLLREGKPVTDVAAQLGVHAGNVSRALGKARRILQDCMTPKGWDNRELGDRL